MDLTAITTEAEYDRALAEIAQYFELTPPPGSPEAARFDALAALILAYEAHAWAIDPA